MVIRILDLLDIPYAFRGGHAIREVWGADTCSAEWPEDLALELGDRVSMAWFEENIMDKALIDRPWSVTFPGAWWERSQV